MTGAPSSRSAVRTTLANWLADGGVDGLNKVWTTFPKRFTFQENAQAGQMSRCQAVVFIADEHESRLSIGGAHNGWKRVDYTVILQVFQHSLHRNADDAMSDFDTTIDGIKARLRSDHNFGDTTGSLVWQGAEPALDVHYGEPATVEGEAVETYAEIQFAVTQMIQA